MVVWVAANGIAINIATALMFFSGRTGEFKNLDAFLHMATDAVVLLGIVLARVAILLTGWQ